MTQMIEIGGPAEHTFADPLGLLSDCHRRIELFHGRLMVAVARYQGGPLPVIALSPIEACLRYFTEAAPRHTADEEESLFPLLLATGDPATVPILARLAALDADHRRMAADHATVHDLFRRWLDQDGLPTVAVSQLQAVLDGLGQLYGDHIAFEDATLFPHARACLSEAQLTVLGKEMAARRDIAFP